MRWNAGSLGAPKGLPSMKGTHNALGGPMASECSRTRLMLVLGMPPSSR